MNLCYAFLPHLRDYGGGVIVNVASGAGLHGGPAITRQKFADVYAASKAGVISFTKAIALEHAADKMRANCIAPGRSGSLSKPSEELEIGAAAEDAALPDSSRISPLGRFGRPDDMGQAVAFLMSDRASYITGSCLDVTGGIRRH
jgi:NAD(P)-dependent dehydrogenase (short-subunit alcohol dehydrogenase family)